MAQHLGERRDRWPSPFQLPLLGSRPGPDRQPDVVLDQPVKHAVDAAEFLELVEDQLDDDSGLLVGVELHLSRRQDHVAHRHAVEQFAASRLVVAAAFRGDCA